MDEEEIQLLYLLKEASAVAGYDADCRDYLAPRNWHAICLKCERVLRDTKSP